MTAGIKANVDGSAAIQVGGSDAINISSGLSVGIGTSSPAYPLQVSTASETNIAITGGTASETNIFFGDSGSAVIGRITYNNNGDYMRFNVNASERMRIDSSGNVGIGTSSPVTRLDVNGSIKGAVTSGVAVASTSGTSIDFTGIPSWVKRITVMFSGVSTNGTSLLIVQLGSGSVTTSGYSSSGSTNGATSANITTGLLVNGRGNASSARIGNLIISNITGNTWVMSGVTGANDASTPNYDTWSVYGSIILSGTLDRVRITTVNGTDAFDAGTINILYEG